MRPSRLMPAAEPNITPLIDVLLVLLIIFMAALPLTQKGLDINVPSEVQRDERMPAPPDRIVVEYTAGRAIALNRKPVTWDQLESQLRTVFAARRDKTMFIIGDPSVRYGEIVDIIDAAKGAGVEKVGIVTMGMRQAANPGAPSGL